MEGWESVGVRGVDDNIAIQALMEDIIERKGEWNPNWRKEVTEQRVWKVQNPRKKVSTIHPHENLELEY